MLSSSKMERSTPVGSRMFSAKQQLQRKRPSKVQLDSQHLFEQSLKLNNQLNRLLEQNKDLKKGFSKVDSVRNYKQGLIFSVQNIIKQKSKQLKNETKSSSWLVYNLKKKINQMSKQLETKQKQIEEFSSSKIALILKQKEEQAKLLKSLTEKHSKNNKNPPPENEILDELIEMRLYSELQSQYILELNSNISVEKLNTKKILQEISSEKKELEIKRQESENSRKIEEMSRMEKQMEIMQMDASDSGETEEMIQELEITRKLQSQQITDLEGKIEKIIERENAEKKRLETKIIELEAEVSNSQLQIRKTQFKAEIKPEQVQEIVQTKPAESHPTKLVSQLKLKDVEEIGQNLKYRLSIKRLSHSDWKSLIVSEQDQLTISIRQLINILQEQPFGVDDQNSIKLARYLIQQTNGKYFYNQNIRQDIPIVKSILEKLISNLIVYTPQQQRAFSNQVGQVTLKYHVLLIGGLETKTNKKGYVHKNLIVPVFDACSMEFTPKQIEFITFYLYGHSQSLDKLMYKNLIKIGVQPIKYRK